MTRYKDLVGETVAVAYNLAKCKPGAPPAPGEACFGIREKPSTSSPVILFAPEVLLRNVEMVVHEGGLRQVQRAKQRMVFAYVVGEVMPLSTKVPESWYGLGISPVPPPKGRGEKSFMQIDARGGRKPVREAAWFFGSGRKSAISQTRTRANPGDAHNVDQLRDMLEMYVPDLYEEDA